jgi:hypothetical protein
MGNKSIQDELKSESAKVVSELQTLRDQIRLKLHLASAEGKDAWNKLEPQLDQFEQHVGQAAETAVTELKHKGTELKASFERLYQSLHKS